MQVTFDLAALIGLGVSLLTIIGLFIEIGRYRKEREEMIRKRTQDQDRTNMKIDQILAMLKDIKENICLLYEADVPMLEGQKVSLMKIAEMELDGQVKKALENVVATQDRLMRHLTTSSVGGTFQQEVMK